MCLAYCLWVVHQKHHHGVVQLSLLEIEKSCSIPCSTSFEAFPFLFLFYWTISRKTNDTIQWLHEVLHGCLMSTNSLGGPMHVFKATLNKGPWNKSLGINLNQIEPGIGLFFTLKKHFFPNNTMSVSKGLGFNSKVQH